MIKSLGKSSEKSGMRPGSLVHVGEVSGSVPKMRLMNYSKEKVEQEEFVSIFISLTFIVGIYGMNFEYMP